MDQVRNYSISLIIIIIECVRRESRSSGELNQVITRNEWAEWTKTEGNRAGCKLDILELGTEHESEFADSFEVFAADDTFEGGEVGELPSSMTASLSGKVILLREEQFWNAARSRVLRILLKTTRLREVHSPNALGSMTVSFSGRVIVVRALQSWNEFSAKFVMLLCSRNTTLTRWRH